MTRAFLFIFFGVAGAYATHSAFKYTRMITNIFLGLVYHPVVEDIPPAGGEKVTILDSADREMEALWLENKNSDRTVIFCHESGATKESWGKYAYFFPALGFHVLSVDFTVSFSDAEKNSLAQWPEEEDVERLLTAVRWVKKAAGSQMKIVLFGASKGADIAFAASFEDPSIAAVIADGLFSMKEIFRDYIRKWAPILVKPNLFGEKYPAWVVNLFSNLGFWYCQKKSKRRFVDVEPLLKKSHKPFLMIHGEEDSYIPLDHQHFLEKIDQNKGSAYHLVIPRAGHNESVVLSRGVYEKKVKEFLKKVI